MKSRSIILCITLESHGPNKTSLCKALGTLQVHITLA